MGQQVELPTRKKGSYKRVWLNDLDSLIRSLQNQGIKEDLVEFTQYFLNDIQDFLPNDIEIKYTENSFVVYTAKHRAFKVRPETKNISCFGILKDYEKEYRDVRSSQYSEINDGLILPNLQSGLPIFLCGDLNISKPSPLDNNDFNFPAIVLTSFFVYSG